MASLRLLSISARDSSTLAPRLSGILELGVIDVPGFLLIPSSARGLDLQPDLVEFCLIISKQGKAIPIFGIELRIIFSNLSEVRFGLSTWTSYLARSASLVELMSIMMAIR
jgi:hypothetical protein